MAVFVDPTSGKVFQNVPDDQVERARTEFGLVPQAEYDKQKTLDDAGQGTGLQSLGEGIERGVGTMAAGIQAATGFGTAPGLVDNEQGEQLPGGGLGALQNAYTHEADLRRQAHPLLSGLGQGIGMAPAAAAAGALGAAALPAEIPLVGGAAGGLLGESLAGGTQQEYDDAWFEKRPMEASNIAANTFLFAGGDLLFRGALKGGLAVGKRLLFGPEAATATSLGGRNLISEAQGAAREAADVAPSGGGGSVGAASAKDLVEPFDEAIKGMSEKDAAVLARDANDHLHLVSQDASEAMTRVNQGLSDNLGSQLKYEDFATNAEHWEAPLLERQAGWLDEMTNKGDEIARQVEGGRKGGLDFGNLGKKAAQIIDTFNQRITEEADPARRNYLTDSVKKQLDGLTNSIDSSFGVDQVTRTDLKKIIGPFREELRNGLMNAKYWGENAEMQRALNGPWTQLLEHWSKVQNTLLEATGHTAFDQMGAGRITKESTVDRMRAIFGKDPRANQEMGRHLSGAFDGLQGLVEARQAHGIANTDGLEAMAGDIRNLMEDWNLATTVKVAENRVANLKRDPRRWASLALDLGERLPLVGKPIHVARSLGDAFTDLHLEKGKALGNLWDQGYRRFAQNPALQDPSISSNYADWILDALRQRGGNVPVPPAGNMGAPMQAAANAGQGGFRQAAQPAAAGQAAAQSGSLFGGAAQHVQQNAGKLAVGAGLVGAGALADDKDHGYAGAGVGLLALPLILTPAGRKLGLLEAVHAIERAADEAGLTANRFLDWHEKEKILTKAFGTADSPGVKLANQAFDTLRDHGLDLAHTSERELESKLDYASSGQLKAKIDHARKAFSTELGQATRQANKTGSPATVAARATLGPLGEALDEPFTGTWSVYGKSRVDQTISYSKDGDTLGEVLKRRLQSKAPLTLDELQKKAFRLERSPEWLGPWNSQTGKFDVNPQQRQQIASFEAKRDAQMGGLKGKVAEATAGIAEDDTTARAMAEDDALRTTLKDALGMKTRKPKELAMNVDASSRYYKRKAGFDAWASVALNDDEQEALRHWQSYRYRVTNAYARSGPGAMEAPARELAEMWEQRNLLAHGQGIDEATQAMMRDTPQTSATLLDTMNKAITLGYNVPGRVQRGISMPAEEFARLQKASAVTAQGFMSTSVHAGTPEAFATRRAGQLGELPVMITIDQKTGVPIGQAEGELTLRPGTKFAVDHVEPPDADGIARAHLREIEPSSLTPADLLQGIAGKIPTEAKIAGGLLAVGGAGLASSNAQAAEPQQQQPDRPPPPTPTPLPAYSGALREINKAGDAQIQAFASSLLRKRDPGAGSKTPLALFGGRRSLTDSVDGVRQRLGQIAGDPGALVETLAGSVGDLWKTHPTVYAALVQRATEVANYLHGALPPQTATTLLNPQGAPLSFDRSWDFAAKFVGAALPKLALREVTRGSAPPEMIEALQANHPELWEGLRAQVLGMVQRMADAGRHIPSEKLARLDRELGMDGQLDPSMSLAVASHFLAAQDAEAQKRQQTGGSGKMPPSAGGSSFRTPLDAINNERAHAS